MLATVCSGLGGAELDGVNRVIRTLPGCLVDAASCFSTFTPLTHHTLFAIVKSQLLNISNNQE